LAIKYLKLSLFVLSSLVTNTISSAVFPSISFLKYSSSPLLRALTIRVVTVHIPPPFRRRASRGSWAA
jgi:hypothetical protein